MVNAAQALEQIDGIIERYEAVAEERFDEDGDAYNYLTPSVATEVVTASLACTERVTGRNSTYYEQMRKALEATSYYVPVEQVVGALRALRADVAGGYLSNVLESIRGDYGSDILSFAESLLAENGNGPVTAAAVLAGGVLEEHIRNLCNKHDISTERETNRGVERNNLDSMNNELRKEEVYGKVIQTNVTAWYHIRNHAARAEYDQYDTNQVRLMIMGVRTLLATYPA